jgi:hypothetical protein
MFQRETFGDYTELDYSTHADLALPRQANAQKKKIMGGSLNGKAHLHLGSLCHCLLLSKRNFD